MQTHYIRSLTPLRGIAALWVVLFHIDVSLYYRDLGALLARDATGIFSRGYLWVDFFFLLSGFIIAHVYGERLAGPNKFPAIKDYLWARFARIYPLHLFTLLLLVIAAPIAAHFFPQAVDGSWTTYFAWSALPSNLLFTHAMNQHVYLSWNMVSWSIGAEWWTYVVALLAIIPLWRRSFMLTLASMLLAFIGLTALVYWLPDNNLDITFNYGFLRCLFEFIIGFGVYRLYQQQLGARWLQRDLCSGLLLLTVAAIFHFKLPDLIVLPVFVLLILSVANNHSQVSRILNLPAVQYLGTISYSVYLMHGIWFLLFWFLLPWIKTEFSLQQLSGQWKLIYTMTFLLATLVSAHFTYRYIEVPGRRWFKPTKRPASIGEQVSP